MFYRENGQFTPIYSFRLVASLQLGRDWRAVLARIKAPTEIVIGANDELFNADQFQPTLQAINPRIGVTVVPNEGHLAMIADPAQKNSMVTAALWPAPRGTRGRSGGQGDPSRDRGASRGE